MDISKFSSAVDKFNAMDKTQAFISKSAFAAKIAHADIKKINSITAYQNKLEGVMTPFRLNELPRISSELREVLEASNKLKRLSPLREFLSSEKTLMSQLRLNTLSGKAASGFSYIEEALKLYRDIEEDDSEEVQEEKKESQIIQLNHTIQVQGIIKNIFEDNKELYKVPPRKFEEMIAELLEKKNYHVDLTKQTRDGGRDIIAIKHMDGFPNKYLIECKRQAKNRPVSIDVIRSLGFVLDRDKANKGIIFTSSYFTPDAIKERDQYLGYRMDLRDGMAVLAWIKEYINEMNF